MIDSRVKNMRGKILKYFFTIYLTPIVLSSPVVDPLSNQFEFPDCFLPSELGPTSGVKFLEDCDSLGQLKLSNFSS